MHERGRESERGKGGAEKVCVRACVSRNWKREKEKERERERGK